MEDNLQCKMSFDGRQSFIGANLGQETSSIETTLKGRQPLGKDEYQWMTTFD